MLTFRSLRSCILLSTCTLIVTSVEAGFKVAENCMRLDENRATGLSYEVPEIVKILHSKDAYVCTSKFDASVLLLGDRVRDGNGVCSVHVLELVSSPDVADSKGIAANEYRYFSTQEDACEKGDLTYQMLQNSWSGASVNVDAFDFRAGKALLQALAQGSKLKKNLRWRIFVGDEYHAFLRKVRQNSSSIRWIDRVGDDLHMTVQLDGDDWLIDITDVASADWTLEKVTLLD